MSTPAVLSGAWARRGASWREAAVEACVLLALLPAAAAVAASLAGGAGAYAHWWGTPRGWQALARTVELSCLAAAIALILASLVSRLAVTAFPSAAAGVAMMCCLPILLPASSLALAWSMALAPLERALGFSACSLPGAAAVLALRYFGVAAIILTRWRLERRQLWPAEQVFRIAPLAAAWHLHLRPAARSAAMAGLLVALLCMNDHVIPADLLVSTYGTQVMIQYAAMQDLAGATALAVPMAAVGAAMVGLTLLIGRGGWTAESGPASAAGSHVHPAARLASAGLLVLLLATALALPIGVLAWQAGSPQAVTTMLDRATPQLRETLYCTAVAATACTILAASLAQHWIDRRRQGQWTAVPLVLLNLTVPASLLALGTIHLTQRGPLALPADSAWPLIICCAARLLPLATLAFYAVWRNLSPLNELAAAVHGVARWRSAWRVSWPTRSASVAAVVVLVAVLIVTDVEMSLLLQATGRSTVGVRLSTLIHQAPRWMPSALTLGIVAITAPGILTIAVLLRPMRGKLWSSLK